MYTLAGRLARSRSSGPPEDGRRDLRRAARSGSSAGFFFISRRARGPAPSGNLFGIFVIVFFRPRASLSGPPASALELIGRAAKSKRGRAPNSRGLAHLRLYQVPAIDDNTYIFFFKSDSTAGRGAARVHAAHPHRVTFTLITNKSIIIFNF